MSQPAEKVNQSAKALVALGSNTTSRHGNPRETLEKALDVLGDGPVDVLGRSRFFLTPCFPAGAGPDYVNAVALVETNMSPEALLDRLHEIEAAFDRERDERWASRTLDLDLLLMDEKICPDQPTLREWVNLPEHAQRELAPDHLVLPHPRMQDRAFVLVPAAEVAPNWRHPLTGRTIREMCDALPSEDVAAVVPLED